MCVGVGYSVDLSSGVDPGNYIGRVVGQGTLAAPKITLTTKRGLGSTPQKNSIKYRFSVLFSQLIRNYQSLENACSNTAI